MKKIPLVAGLLLLAAIGYGMWRASSSAFMTTLVRNSDYDLRLEIRETIVTGSPATLTIRPYKNGKPVDMTKENRSLHAVLLSEDNQDMLHTVNFHYQADGSAELVQTFTRPGTYRVWIEVDDDSLEDPHGEHASLIAWQDFPVTGDTFAATVPPTPGAAVSGSGYTLTMSHDPLVAGAPLTLRFAVTDARGNLVDLPPHDPILFGLASADRAFFIHGHMYTDRDGKGARYDVTLPVPGRYDLFTQTFWMEGMEFRLLEGHFALNIAAKN